jgi:hypothetical protein
MIAIVAVAAAVMWLSSVAAAQTVIAGANGTVTVRADREPLGRVLRAFDAIRPFQKLLMDATLEDRLVTVVVKDTTVRAALVAVLESTDVDYGLTADEDGRSIRLVVRPLAPLAAQALMPSASPSGVPASDPTPRAQDDAPPLLESEPPELAEEEQAKAQAAIDDAAREGMAHQQIHFVLTTPPPIRRAGDVMELPVPGPDGRPLTAVVQPAASRMLPFPATLETPAPAPLPLSASPELRDLYEALIPR